MTLLNGSSLILSLRIWNEVDVHIVNIDTMLKINFEKLNVIEKNPKFIVKNARALARVKRWTRPFTCKVALSWWYFESNKYFFFLIKPIKCKKGQMEISVGEILLKLSLNESIQKISKIWNSRRELPISIFKKKSTEHTSF